MNNIVQQDITTTEIGTYIVPSELTPCEFDKLRDKQHARNKQKTKKIKWYSKFEKRKYK